MGSLLTLYIITGVFGLGVTIIDLVGIFGDDTGDMDAEGDLDGDSGVSVIAHEGRNFSGLIIKIITLLRSLIYFCLGFGVIGFIAVYTGRSFLSALIWSVGAGVLSTFLAHLLKRLLRKEIDSTIKESELLMEKGEVLVSILPGKQGKVRIKVGGAYIDRYARADKLDSTLKPGEKVYVTDIADDGVVVSLINN